MPAKRLGCCFHGSNHLLLKTTQAAYYEAAGTIDAIVVPPGLAHQLARLCEFAQPAFAHSDARLREMSEQLADFSRQPQPELSTALLLLQNFKPPPVVCGARPGAAARGFAALAGADPENMAVLCLDDQWLEGQLSALQTATEPPLTLPRLQEMEQRLQEVIFKQTEAKERLVQAQNQVRDLLATFIDRLADIGDTNSSYHDHLEQCAAKLTKVSQLHEITPLLEDVIGATRAMADRCDLARP